MSRSLENMTALVTGASSGIGRGTASILARSNARDILVERRQSVREGFATECGPLASAYHCDMTDDAQLRSLATKIRADFARIAMLVHSSGIIKLGRIETSSLADFDAQYAANVCGPYDGMLQPEDVPEAIFFALTIGRTAEVTDLYLRPMLKPLA
jgi:NAD(P)-dependent dehydrogenase (short-subunit alcohol dehydrogenase family)